MTTKLTFQQKLVKIAHAQHRQEKHGTDDVPAVDIKLIYTAPNDVLAQFSSTLKESLFWLDETVQGQVVRDPDYLPNVKNPKIEPLKWRDRYENMVLIVHHRVEEKNNLVFAEAKVGKFVIHPMEGGTVTIELQVQALLGDNSFDELIKLEKKEVHISLVEADNAQGDLLAA